jgi:2,4-dienoyl-CoA reductase-like NADH-dependent reductase (Old Yellow Enzyme family)
MSAPSLFEPLLFPCGASAPNRVALAPLTNQQSEEDGTLSEDELRWLVRRATGGFGIVETCAAHVCATGKGFEGQLGAWSDAHQPGLRRLAAAIAATGALGLVQLYHGGVRSPSRLTGQRPWSASEFEEEREGFERPRAATEGDLEAVLAAFVAAARRCAAAGFGGVELHGAHGYLFSQFLSRTMNTRADAWGGDLRGRARLLREALRQVRAATPAGFVVGVRLSLEDFGYARGLDLDESVTVAQWLAEEGADFIHASLWDVHKCSLKYPEESVLPRLRAALPRSVPIIAAGKIWTVADAAATLALGADAVALGRAAILNPDWPREAQKEGFTPTRGPLSAAALAERAVGPRFLAYLRRFPNMVEEG